MGNRRIALIVAAAVCLPFALNGCGEIPFPTGESVSTAAPVVEVEEAAVESGLRAARSSGRTGLPGATSRTMTARGSPRPTSTRSGTSPTATPATWR